MERRVVKIISILLTFSLLLSGCGWGREKSKETEQSEAPVSDTITVGEESGGVVEIEDPGQEPQYVIKDEELISNRYCRIILQEIQENHEEIKAKLLIENRCEADVTVYVETAAVNGIVVDVSFFSNIASEKSARTNMSFSKPEMERLGLKVVEKLSFKIACMYAESMEELFSETITVYPTGEAPEKVQNAALPGGEAGEVVYDNEYGQFIILGTEINTSYNALVIHCRLVNSTDREVVIHWKSASIGEYMFDPFWGYTMPPETSTDTEIWLEEAFLREQVGLDPSEIDAITFTIVARDANDWLAPVFAEQKYTYAVSSR